MDCGMVLRYPHSRSESQRKRNTTKSVRDPPITYCYRLLLSDLLWFHIFRDRAWYSGMSNLGGWGELKPHAGTFDFK